MLAMLVLSGHLGARSWKMEQALAELLAHRMTESQMHLPDHPGLERWIAAALVKQAVAIAFLRRHLQRAVVQVPQA